MNASGHDIDHGLSSHLRISQNFQNDKVAEAHECVWIASHLELHVQLARHSVLLTKFRTESTVPVS